MPPFRSCLGADDGGQACFIQEGTNVAKLAGRLHATLGAQLGPVFFANLPTGTIDGAVLYVQDGSVTNPCTGGGTGAFAYRVLGAWNCSAASSSSIPAGTLNHLVIYTSSSAIGSDAALTDSGGTLGYTGGVFNATNSTSFTIQTAGGFNITETGTNKAANWNISGQLTVNTGTSLAAGLDGLGETRVTGSPTGEAKTGGNFAVWAGNAAGVGLTNANGMVACGTDLYVVNFGTNSIGKYSTAGAIVSPSLITGLSGPDDIAIAHIDVLEHAVARDLDDEGVLRRRNHRAIGGGDR